MMKFESTDSTTTQIVMIAEFEKNCRNGIAVTALTKFPNSGACGISVGGNFASSWSDFSAEAIIQYSGSRNRMLSAIMTTRAMTVEYQGRRVPSARRL